MNLRIQQSGFTLIELIMVIVIVGILAAVALPRFADLQGDARHAKGQALVGSIRSASAVAHATALARNATGATSTITMEGATINMVYGYPAATALGIIAAANIDATRDNVTITAGADPATDPITVDINGAGTLANCRISYTAAASASTQPVISFNGSASNCL